MQKTCRIPSTNGSGMSPMTRMGKRIFCTMPCIILSVFLLKNGTMNNAPAAMASAMPP